VPPTKQARGNSGKEPILHQVTECRKNFRRNQVQSGGQSTSGQQTHTVVIMIQAPSQIRNQKCILL